VARPSPRRESLIKSSMICVELDELRARAASDNKQSNNFRRCDASQPLDWTQRRAREGSNGFVPISPRDGLRLCSVGVWFDSQNCTLSKHARRTCSSTVYPPSSRRPRKMSGYVRSPASSQSSSRTYEQAEVGCSQDLSLKIGASECLRTCLFSGSAPSMPTKSTPMDVSTASTLRPSDWVNATERRVEQHAALVEMILVMHWSAGRRAGGRLIRIGGRLRRRRPSVGSRSCRRRAGTAFGRDPALTRRRCRKLVSEIPAARRPHLKVVSVRLAR
jgi:hypothetical protein